ncbi:MAG: DUF1801 domain-containing protein [Pseudomonadales bacterium]|nr:DUF1801 domain-containing protein [Pseudomonadales bacterium]
MTRAVSKSLRQFLSAYAPEIADIYLKTRQTVLAKAPHANELIYDAYNALSCVYSFTENMKQGFIHIAAYPNHVNLGFNQGVSLEDPDSLLLGHGSHIRHIKIGHGGVIHCNATLALIESAVMQGKRMQAANPGATPSFSATLVKSVSDNKRRP